MAEWKVSRQQIELKEHTNADTLQLGDVGGYQVVVQKGLYQDGDVVVFIPEKSCLPDIPRFESFKPYLKGSDKDRVGSIRLRGELSQGILLPDEEEFQQFAIDEDFSEHLGIKKYDPPPPPHLSGMVHSTNDLRMEGATISYHDVEHFGIYRDEFEAGEEVVVTEKVHGSQVTFIRTKSGQRALSSKGLIKQGLTLRDEEKNTYWQAAHNTGVFDLLDQFYPDVHVQAFGEVIPVQKGFPYGFKKPWVLLFDIRINGKSVFIDEIPTIFFQTREECKWGLWCPVLYQGPLDVDKIKNLSLGSEEVTGKGIHKKEGVVVRPYLDRRASKGFRLMLKVINPKYKETGEEFS
jgi:RNA ligase (TIGR02306 family)